MNGASKTPVAVFTYNRAHHVQTCLEALSRCDRLDECALHIFCDGPKSGEPSDSVEQSRRVVREWGAKLNARIVERDSNLGLARSIVGGVTELCEEYGRVIVVEDDLIVSPGFLAYMLQGLSVYERTPNVRQVSGYMFPLTYACPRDAFFIPLVTTWGWATWRHAWQIFDWTPPDVQQLLSDPEVSRAFDLDGSYPYSGMLNQRLAGEGDSWGILWWWAVFRAKGISLYPRQSLVQNSGFDGSGTHTPPIGARQRLEQRELQSAREAGAFRFPDTVEIDTVAFDLVKRFLRHQDRPAPPSIVRRLWWRVVGWLRRR